MPHYAANGSPGPLKVLVFAASTREKSHNRRLARLAARTAEQAGAVVDLVDFDEFDAPSYSQDLQAAGFPAGAERLRDRLEKNDAFILAAPEYNFSMPGSLKNSIDWVSRYRPHPLQGLHGLLMSASPSMVGGNRGLWALRVPLEHLGSHIFPDMFSLARAGSAFADDGSLADEQLQGRFDQTVCDFLELVEAARNYPCAREWIEFRSEPAVSS